MDPIDGGDVRVVIVGGVAGGMSAATRLRRLNAEAEIVVIERSRYVSYANCGLPYFLGGVIDEKESLLLQTPESLHDRFRLDVRVASEVVSIDTDAQSVSVKDVVSGDEYDLSYDYLILSPGAAPVIPPIPGIERAYPLRTVEDVERLVDVVNDSPRHALVIGGGFVGLEIAENLTHRGIKTTVVEAASQVLVPLDPEMVIPVAHELRQRGVDVYLGDSVASITPTHVQLTSGEFVAADLVVVAIGVRPDTNLARAAGLAIGERGGIVVDGFQRTSVANIYAVGDAAEKTDALDGASTLVPLANLANAHGRTVADHLSGRTVRPHSSIGTAIVKVFGLTVATTGWNEKRLRASGRAFVVIHTHPASHASYYPGAKSMALKLLVDPSSGQILGAQGVGSEGVDRRIDVLATAIRGHLSAPELADLELAYAPPFGSAKDPINMLGYVAENVLTGLVETIQWSDVAEYRSRAVSLVDVRTAGEFRLGSLPGAINIPVDELRDRVFEIEGSEVVVYCQVGQRGHTATRLLRELGFQVKNLDGGYQTWRHSPAAIETQLVA